MRNRAGLVMVEAMVALALLTGVFVIALQFLPTCVAAYRGAEQAAHAESLARSWLEEQRSLPFAELTEHGWRELAPGEFRVEEQVTRALGQPPAELVCVRVRVSWTWRNRPHVLTREALVGRPL